MIEILKLVLSTLVCAISRGKHGNGKISKLVAVLISGLAIALASNIIIPEYVITVTFLVALGYGPGWGKYFAAHDGKYSTNEKEIWGIDWIADGIFNKTGSDQWAGMVGMSLRWTVFFAPLFIYLEQYWQVAGLLLVGPLYRLAGKLNKEISFAEYITGGLLGFLAVI